MRLSFDWGMRGLDVTGYLHLYREGCEEPIKTIRYTNRRHRKLYIDKWTKEVANLKPRHYIQISVQRKTD